MQLNSILNRSVLLVLMISFGHVYLTGQNVGINDDGSSPNTKAMLDVKSNSKGLLIPRMSSEDRVDIAPTLTERGLMVYDTTANAFYFYDGFEWQELSGRLWTPDANGIHRMSNIGVNSVSQSNYGIYSFRPYGHVGSDTASIYAFRGGESSSDSTGGSAFSTTGTDAAIMAFSDWGNPYSAAIAGYSYLDYSNSAAVVGGTTGGSVYGALGYNMGGTVYSGYFNGDARFEDKVGINTAPSSSFTLNVSTESEDRTAYFYNNKVSTGNTFGLYAGAHGTGSGDKRGGSFDAVGGTGTNIAMRGVALNGATNIGMYANASGGTTNWAGHFDAGYVIVDDRVGVGLTNPSAKMHVYSTDLWAAGYFYNGYNSASNTYGVYAYATSPGDGDARGVYSYCTGLGNYAYYGVGDTYLSGDVRLGTTLNPSGYKLIVDGKIISEELRIQNSTNWPDYVFAEDYDLMSIEELQSSIEANQHLPGIPSAGEVEQNGIVVGDMQKRMMEKIEELTLYVIQLNERIKTLEDENSKLNEAMK